MLELKTLIREVPDYPKKGILFYDLTTLWKEGRAFREIIRQIHERYRDQKIQKILSCEARGFIIGAPLAYEMQAGFVPVRKPGKLPAKVLQKTYELEYGTDTLELHEGAIEKGEKVLIVDDVIATGGTINAVIELVREAGGVVDEVACLVELTFLNPREKVKHPIFSLIQY